MDTVKALHDRGAVFIDTSHPDVWKQQHIPGAVPLTWFRDVGGARFTEDTLMAVADKTEEVVLYCDDPFCANGAAADAAKAANWGYQNVYFFRGGARAWKDAGYPVETGP